MKTHELLLLTFFLSLASVMLNEGLFYLNFSPFSIAELFRLCDLTIGWRLLCSFVANFVFLFLLAILVNLFPNSVHYLRTQIVLCIVLLILFNFALSFYQEMFKKMNLLAEVAMFTWIIFIFQTLFYSIYYRNKIQKEENQKKQRS